MHSSFEKEAVLGGCFVECRHVASCTNKSPGCVSWGSDGLIAIGGGSSLLICENKTKDNDRNFKTVVKTLNGHTGRINCTKWISNCSTISKAGDYILSGSSDRTIMVWKCFRLDECGKYVFENVISLKGHTDAVTCVNGTFVNLKGENSTRIFVVSASVDCSLNLWSSPASCDPKHLRLSQKIDLRPSLGLAVSFHHFSNGIPLLACGLDNSRVNLYSLKENNPNFRDESEFSLLVCLHGHEDWVRGADFVTLGNGELLLATCSQDTFIRLWRIAPRNEEESSETDVLKLRETKFTLKKNETNTTYIVTLEAVLSGHEGWVYSVQWGMEKSDLRLLSSSMDKSVIIWKVDKESGIWVEEARFGEVGGNTLGFYGAQFNPTASEVLAHSFNGALHLWQKKSDNEWKSGVVLSGHFGDVLDLSWEPRYGRYFVTTSSDQTTRLYGTWKGAAEDSWHEIARPQVHGYDMQCIAMIDSLRFISGADEKVLRVFEAPQNFVQNLSNLTGLKLTTQFSGPEGAAVPALGLSNKAVFPQKGDVAKETPTSRGEQYIENQFKKLILDQPPTEEYLLQNSLWPETHKLYWHVFEIFCVAANSSGTLVASAAKSATPEHSTIVLWDTKSWKEVAQLHGHTLTVTQMEFSHDGRFLLSVSRDRTWILHKILGDHDHGFSTFIYAKSDKKTCHSRIIWSASWTHDGKYFCTGSRDKKVMFWRIEENDSAKNENIDTRTVSRVLVASNSESVTAVSFATKLIRTLHYLLALGKESGRLELHIFSATSEFSCVLLHQFDMHASHASTVKRLQWRPQVDNDEHWIATCAADNLVKLFSVSVK